MSKFISDADMEALEKSSAPAAPAAPRKKAFISDADMAALEGGAPKAAAPAGSPSLLDKLKALPGGIAETAKSAADYVGRSVRGEIPLSEQAERLGTLARAAGDGVQAVGDLPAKAIGALIPGVRYDGAGAKETAKVLDSAGLADKAALDAQDLKYSGARALGLSLPALALGGTGIAAGAATSAIGSIGAQTADKGTWNPEDVVFDAVLGAAVPAVLRGGKEVAKAAAPYAETAAKWGGTQAARVVTGLPEDTIQRYAGRNAQVRAARPLEDVATDTTDAVGRLADKVSEGSTQSVEALVADGAEVPKNVMIAAYDDALARMGRESEWTDDAERSLEQLKRLRGRVDAKPGEVVGPNEAKGFLKQLGDLAYPKRESAAAIPQGVQREARAVRGQVDEFVKEVSPSYKAKMAEVASDTQLLKRLETPFKNEEAAYGTLNRIARDRAPFRDRTLRDLDAVAGTDFAEAARDSMAKDAFQQRSVNGSRNVNFLSNIPVVGAVLGYAADYMARPGTAKVIDWGLAAKEMAGQLPPKYARALEASAVKGPQSLLLTHSLLMQSDAEYRRLNGGK